MICEENCFEFWGKEDRGIIKVVFKCFKGYREGEIYLFYLVVEDIS